MDTNALLIVVAGLLGAFIGGFIFRSALRAMYGKPILQISFNTCPSSKKRFRLIELVPIFGTVISERKDRNYEDNFAGSALLAEIMFFCLTPVILLGISNTLYQLLALLVLLIGQVYVVYSLVNGHKQRSEQEVEEPTNTKVISHIGMVRKQHN